MRGAIHETSILGTGVMRGWSLMHNGALRGIDCPYLKTAVGKFNSIWLKTKTAAFPDLIAKFHFLAHGFKALSKFFHFLAFASGNAQECGNNYNGTHKFSFHWLASNYHSKNMKKTITKETVGGAWH